MLPLPYEIVFCYLPFIEKKSQRTRNVKLAQGTKSFSVTEPIDIWFFPIHPQPPGHITSRAIFFLKNVIILNVLITPQNEAS